MKRLKITSVCAIAVCAAFLASAGVATAATYELTGLPELGRCVRVTTPKTGQYKYKNCIAKSETSKGQFEWEPGPGEKPGFVAEAGEVHLETVGGVRVGCASGEVGGVWTGSKTASVTITLRGCESKGHNCGANPSKPSEITNEGSPAEGELGFLMQGSKPRIGLDLKPKSPATTLLTFTCGGPPEVTVPEPWTVEGSMIGRIRGGIDKMSTSLALLYQALHGKQIPEKFESGVKDTPLVNRVTESGPVAEEAGLTLTEEKPWIPGENEEPLEIKAKA